MPKMTWERHVSEQGHRKRDQYVWREDVYDGEHCLEALPGLHVSRLSGSLVFRSSLPTPHSPRSIHSEWRARTTRLHSESARVTTCLSRSRAPYTEAWWLKTRSCALSWISRKTPLPIRDARRLAGAAASAPTFWRAGNSAEPSAVGETHPGGLAAAKSMVAARHTLAA